MRTRLTALVLAGALLARVAAAQSLYTFGPVGAVTELTGPPGACGYPNGPVISAFPTPGVPCPGPGPFAPPLGDVAVDVTMDIVYVTDGALVAAYTAAGLHLGSIPTPAPLGPLTGMGIDSLGGLLWITDGALYGALALPLPLCGPPPPYAVGPFPVAIGPIFAGPIGDIDWEAGTGSLLACDATGLVGSFLPGALPVPGPYGVFPVSPGPCALAPALVGIAFDRALPGTGTLYVTDGVMVARLLPPGVPAPPSFYATVPCFPAVAPPSAGLSQAGRQITYGAGLDNSGLPAPTIGAVGQSWVGNPAYTVTLSGSVPGGTAYLKYSFGALCPSIVRLGVPVYIGVPRFNAIVTPVGAGGTASMTAAIPPAIGAGATVFMQWVVFTGSSVQVTAGAELTTVAP